MMYASSKTHLVQKLDVAGKVRVLPVRLIHARHRVNAPACRTAHPLGCLSRLTL